MFLLIIQCNGKNILWKHLEQLYEEDTSKEAGLRLIPKLKCEHVHLNSFSKIRVDLAEISMLAML